MKPISHLVAIGARPVNVVYPDSDGQPMAEGTLQYDWITTIKGNLDIGFDDCDDVFIAGDLFWYAVEGQPGIRVAPDVLVVFGRPRGHRRSYRQWLEEDIAPQVVFEILSPSNTAKEMEAKFKFYEKYGVEEYYVFDPDNIKLQGWLRSGVQLQPIPNMEGWVSPRLKVRFDTSHGDLTLTWPDGRRFLTLVEIARRTQQAEEARQEADQAREQAENDARQARERADRLLAQLRALGLEPET